jgi:hypothetical protein
MAEASFAIGRRVDSAYPRGALIRAYGSHCALPDSGIHHALNSHEHGPLKYEKGQSIRSTPSQPETPLARTQGERPIPGQSAQLAVRLLGSLPAHFAVGLIANYNSPDLYLGFHI